MEGKNMEKIGGKKEEDVEKRVVIGKGKGIGVEGMVWKSNEWVKVKGEGGNIDIGKRKERE